MSSKSQNEDEWVVVKHPAPKSVKAVKAAQADAAAAAAAAAEALSKAGEKATRAANVTARSLYRRRTLDGKGERPMPVEIKVNLIDKLKQANFKNVSINDSYKTAVIEFTTPEGYACHITLHVADVDDPSAVGAFHVVIEERKIPKSKQIEDKRYYRFKPIVDIVNENNILHFEHITYKPRSENIYGKPDPLPEPLNTHMNTVLTQLNSVNIPMGTSVVAAAAPPAAAAATSLPKAKVNRWGVHSTAVAKAPTQGSRAAGAGNNNSWGGKRQTKKNKVSRRKTRRNRS